jgi:hypothetical protein
MWMQDNDVVWGMVNDVLIRHRVNAGEAKAPIGSGQKQRYLRVGLLHNELISHLQQRVNPQAEENTAVDLYKLQRFNNDEVPQQKPRTIMSLRHGTSKLHHTPSAL